jgi:hypothetical protein
MLLITNTLSLFAFITSSTQNTFTGSVVDGSAVVIAKSFTITLNGSNTTTTDGTFSFINTTEAAQINAKVVYQGLTVFNETLIDMKEPMVITVTQKVV